MCGIAALFSTGAEVPAAALRAMCEQVRHRGPDGDGGVLFRGASLDADLRPVAEAREAAMAMLGHTRLSIVDLTQAGNQPMERDDAWIVYNGEIYNHVELRRELEASGASFRSSSDTEVILAAYRRWGSDCLNRLNGMFAFVLVDRRMRSVLVARDRFGVKPLYWWRSAEGLLAFCSEIKQLTVLPGWRAGLNGPRARDFLVHGIYDHTRETLFRGVYQLRGGELVELRLDEQGRIRDGELRPRRWYAPPQASFRGRFEEAAARVQELLRDSVRLRLRADVEVGSCLSGGLDSSAIVCLAAELLGGQANSGQATFSACWHVPRFDERPYIDQVAAATGVRAHYVYPDLDEMFERVDELIWHQDEPFGSTSIFAQWSVFRLAARSGIKVMLDGQGADEALGGYHSYLGARFGSLLRELRWIRLLSEMADAKRVHRYGLLWSARQAAGAALPASLAAAIRSLAPAPSWLAADALAAGAQESEYAPSPRHSVSAFAASQVLQTSLPALLHWEDRASMASSVESRVPFLDYRLVELALSLPDEFKVAGGMTKRVLREAMRGVMPEPVRSRQDKLGFQTPEREWLTAAPERFRATMQSAIETSQGILNANAMNVLEDAISGKRPFTFLFWRLLSFGRWMRAFDVARTA